MNFNKGQQYKQEIINIRRLLNFLKKTSSLTYRRNDDNDDQQVENIENDNENKKITYPHQSILQSKLADESNNTLNKKEEELRCMKLNQIKMCKNLIKYVKSSYGYGNTVNVKNDNEINSLEHEFEEIVTAMLKNGEINNDEIIFQQEKNNFIKNYFFLNNKKGIDNNVRSNSASNENNTNNDNDDGNSRKYEYSNDDNDNFEDDYLNDTTNINTEDSNIDNNNVFSNDEVIANTNNDNDENNLDETELLEDEIRLMIQQLKESTISMNQNLKQQTKELDTINTLATDNLDDVSKKTKDVEQHVKKKWGKVFGTWTWIFLIICSFIALCLVIRIMPKQNRQLPNINYNFDFNNIHESFSNLWKQTLHFTTTTFTFSSTTTSSSTNEKKEKEKRKLYGTGEKVYYDDNNDYANDEEHIVQRLSEESKSARKAYNMANANDDKVTVQDKHCDPHSDSCYTIKDDNVNENDGKHTSEEEGDYLYDEEEEYYDDTDDVSAFSKEDELKFLKAVKLNDNPTATWYIRNMKSNIIQNTKDDNGWYAVHEASRAGHTNLLNILLTFGEYDNSDNIDAINMRTNFGRGGSALFWAKEGGHRNEDVIHLLEEYGAKDIAPDYA